MWYTNYRNNNKEKIFIMPRKNVNAGEVIYNKWSPEYIKNLMIQIRTMRGETEPQQPRRNYKKRKK